MEYRKIKNNEPQLPSLTGLPLKDFEEPGKEFSIEFSSCASSRTFEGKPGMRLYKPGKTGSLPAMEDKLFFILVFMKTNPLQQHHAASFGITQPKASMFIHLFVPPLRKTLKRPGEIPQGKSIYLEDILKNCADVLPDGTERPVQRPSDHQTADEY
ncbi:hypothetical protein Barb6XT_02918 [Bacteroidales bacterium Barb6XT]|nr:hypothetical protein Barb6XT_02918 [Bacteroidales bacterium Barb6XT]